MAKKSKKESSPPPPIGQTKSFFKIKKSFFYAVVIFLVVISLISGIRIYLRDVYYPQIFIAGKSISLLTKHSAKETLFKDLSQKLNSQKITLKHPSTSQTFELDLSSQINNINFDKALDEAYQYGHNKPFLKPVHLTLEISFDQNLENQLSAISKTIDQEPLDSQLKVEGDQITVTPSQEGLVVDKLSIKQSLLSYINNEKTSTTLDLPIKTAQPNLSYENGLEIKKRLDQIKLSPLKLTFKDQTFDLNLATILDLIDLENTQSTLASLSFADQVFTLKSASLNQSDISDTKLTLNQKKVNDYLTKNISPQIDRSVEEPLFNFEPGQTKVTAFKPPIEGQKLDITKSADKITGALLTPNQTKVELSVQTTQPKNTLANDLGIKELIGEGYSTFSGSIENRIFNVGHGASRIHGVLIPPGETFSFNKTVGDITAATGFKQAYVIKSGRTVLDDGGGICQVSTTLFRAALNAGLPIVQRTAHAYRVGYYEQGFPPGLDATIFYPSVDFQFKNDTPNHILIQTRVIGTSLTIDLYGTSDGRITALSRPVITSQSPAPPELRQDDPTLPKGTVKQVDWAAAGANVTFSRKVTKNGQELINESFRSNYRPWQAIFLVGTKEG